MNYTLATIVVIVSVEDGVGVGVGVKQLSCQMQVVDHLKGKAVKPCYVIGWTGPLEDAGNLVPVGRGTGSLVPRGCTVSSE